MSNSVSIVNEHFQKFNQELKKQGNPELFLKYELVSQTGPSHAPTICRKLTIGEQEFVADALQRKLADQKCARLAIEHFNIPIARSQVVKYTAYIDATPALWHGDMESFIVVLKKSDGENQELKEISVKILKD